MGPVQYALAGKVLRVTPVNHAIGPILLCSLSIATPALGEPTSETAIGTSSVPPPPTIEVSPAASTDPLAPTSEVSPAASTDTPPPTAGTAPAASHAAAQRDEETESDISEGQISFTDPRTEGQRPSTEGDEPRADCVCRPRRRRPRRPPTLEFSFGSAELFTNQSVTDPGGIVRERVIPITALDLFGEYLLHPRLSVMVQFLMPLEPESKLIDGELTLAYVPPAISGGVRATAFYFELFGDTTFEGQFFLLGGSTLGSLSGDAFYPTLGWRAHLSEGKGLALYLGGSFAFRQNTTAVVYGVGHRF